MKTTYINTIALVFILSSFVNNAYSQALKHCVTDTMMNILMAKDPSVAQRMDEAEIFTESYIASHKNQRVMADSEPNYIIPIVFHILHQYGPEDISDAQIMDAVRIVNQDWNHQNPDTANIVTPHFKTIASCNRVQFRLAQIDPNGNCTNGIDRICTPLTNFGSDSAKLNQWPPTKYINVWVVNRFDPTNLGTKEAAGYAYLPAAIDGYNSGIDGVIILNGYVGSIGTSSPNTSRALTHELGHVMNLEHPWGMTNSPGVACGDDNVLDTPHTMGWDHCPADSNAAKICDTVSTSPLYILTENYQNFMDYSYCSVMFTDGQAERIDAALNSTQAGRNNLWSQANLIATGVNTPTAPDSVYVQQSDSKCAPVADFNTNTCFVCQGANVSFTDESWNSIPTGWAWNFSGATPSTSAAQNPTVVFDSLWYHSVSLTATDANGSGSTTKTQYVYVSPSWPAFNGAFSDGFEDPSFTNNNWLIYNKQNDRSYWQVTNKGAFSGQNALYLNAYEPTQHDNQTFPPKITELSVPAGSVDDAITPAICFKYSSSMTLSFDYSCATYANSPIAVIESLTVAYSLNCGQSWSTMQTISGTNLTNAAFWGASYAPQSASQWSNVSINLPVVLNGKNNVRFRFEYTSGPNSNNIYIDNVNISGVLGVNQLSQDNSGFTVYPNPASQNTDIKVSYNLSSEQNVKVVVTDILGKNVSELVNGQQSQGLHTINFNGQNLSQGVYIVKLVDNNGIIAAKKLVIIK